MYLGIHQLREHGACIPVKKDQPAMSIINKYSMLAGGEFYGEKVRTR